MVPKLHVTLVVVHIQRAQHKKILHQLLQKSSYVLLGLVFQQPLRQVWVYVIIQMEAWEQQPVVILF